MSPAEINARGHAASWQAQVLEARAKAQGETMAAAWRRDVAQSVAFSVPARCIGVSARRVSYEFADGSCDSYPLPGVEND
jgi:hypothetical protein